MWKEFQVTQWPPCRLRFMVPAEQPWAGDQLLGRSPVGLTFAWDWGSRPRWILNLAGVRWSRAAAKEGLPPCETKCCPPGLAGVLSQAEQQIQLLFLQNAIAHIELGDRRMALQVLLKCCSGLQFFYLCLLWYYANIHIDNTAVTFVPSTTLNYRRFLNFWRWP